MLTNYESISAYPKGAKTATWIKTIAVTIKCSHVWISAYALMMRQKQLSDARIALCMVFAVLNRGWDWTDIAHRQKGEPMSDLIYRQDALDCFHDWIDKRGDVHTADEMSEYRAIEDLPSVQPERKTGRWKLQTIRGKELVYCSECGFGVHTEETRRYSYCPNCGAEMEEL